MRASIRQCGCLDYSLWLLGSVTRHACTKYDMHVRVRPRGREVEELTLLGAILVEAGYARVPVAHCFGSMHLLIHRSQYVVVSQV